MIFYQKSGEKRLGNRVPNIVKNGISPKNRLTAISEQKEGFS